MSDLEDLGLEDSPFSDFLGFELLLEERDRDLLSSVRAFMTREVEPVINDYWTRAEFPHDLVPGIAGSASPVWRTTDRAALLEAPWSTAWSRWSWAGSIRRSPPSWASTAAWPWARSTSAAQTSRRSAGSPAMARMELIGAFGLTEPEHGCGHLRRAVDLGSPRRRHGCSTVRRSGSATPRSRDLVIIWARDEEDEQVKGFVVEKGTDGMSFDKQEDKIALRVVQNARDPPLRRTRVRGQPAPARPSRSGRLPTCCA